MQPKASSRGSEGEGSEEQVGELQLWGIQNGAEPGVPDVPP